MFRKNYISLCVKRLITSPQMVGRPVNDFVSGRADTFKLTDNRIKKLVVLTAIRDLKQRSDHSQPRAIVHDSGKGDKSPSAL